MKPGIALRSLWLILLFVSACVSVSPRANLSATAGSAAIITNDTYRNNIFSLSYPTGWRVITSPAGAQPSVTLVAPGNCALIVVSSSPIDQPPKSSACDQPDIQTVIRNVMLGSKEIAIAGSAPSAGWDDFLSTVDRVAGSLEAGT